MPKTPRRQLKEPKVVICHHCNYATKIKSNLTKHIVNVHLGKRGPPREKHFSCPMCSHNTTRVRMMNHYSYEHNVVMSKSSHNFVNLEDFRTWKTKTEKEEASRYVMLKGVSKLKSCNVWYYRCHRDGFFNSKGTGKRNLKVKGTNKINGCCPSEMKVMEDKTSGAVVVHYVKTHFGHSQDLNRLPLLKEDKDWIAGKLASKVPLSKVLDEIHSSKTGDQVERIHLITRKDVLNIASSYKLKNEFIRKSLEGVGSDMDEWIKRAASETTVVKFYKAEGEKSEEFPELVSTDCILILVNDFQAEYLKCYGGDIVYFDRTHPRNQHDFELTTVMVLDGMKLSVPVALMLSNRIDIVTMTIFVSKLRALVGELGTNTLISDVDDIYYDSWTSLMPIPGCRLFGSWHFDRAVRKNLVKVKNPDKRALTYRNVRCLMTERNQEVLEKTLEPLVAEMKEDLDVASFGQYFEQEFSKNASCWAYCHRPPTSFVLHSNLECCSKAVKNAFLQGKRAKRIDLSMTEVIKLAREKTEQSLVTQKTAIPDISTATKKLHESSMSCQFIVNKTEKGWSCTEMGSSEVFEVTVNNPMCLCVNRCEDCRTCIHVYNCTCLFSSLEWTLCKHMHYVATTCAETVTHVAIQVEHLPQVQIAQPLQVQEVHIIPQVHQQHQIHHHVQPTVAIADQSTVHVALQVHPDALHQHVTNQTQPNLKNIDDDDRDDGQPMEVLQICESNVTSELEDLILGQFASKPKNVICASNVGVDAELKQAKNDALKLVQDIFDAVETKAQLDIFTNAILPVLPTISAMKYSGCT